MKLSKTAIVTFITLIAITAQTPINLSTIVGISQASAQNPQTRQAEADRLFNQGIEQFQKGQLQAALQSWEQALQIYRQVKDIAGEGMTLGNLGNAYYSLGEYRQAIEFYQQRLAIAKRVGDKVGEGRALGNLGNAYYSLGQYNQAIDFHQKSLVIFQQTGDNGGVARTLGNLANAYNSLGDYPKAIDFHQKSLVIFQQIGDKLGESKAFNGLGSVYNSLGDYPKAIDLYQKALAITQQIGDRVTEGRTLSQLGMTYQALGDYAKAIDLYQKALAIAQQSGDKAEVGRGFVNLGSVYDSLGEFQKAVNFYQQGLAIAQQIGNQPGAAAALNSLGNVYNSLGEYQKSIEFNQKSLAIFQQIGNKGGIVIASNNLGNAYASLKQNQKAIDLYKQVLVLSQQIGDRTGEGIVLNNLGLIFFESGNLPEAEKFLRQGIEVWKSQRSRLGDRDDLKISIFEEQARTYRTLQQVLIAQNKIDAALEVAENGRARAFVDLLVSRLNNQTQVANAKDATIDQIKQIAKAQNTTIVEYSVISNYFQVQGQTRNRESELYIWVIKPTGEITFRKTDLKTLWQKENTNLAKLVTNSRESIGVRGRGIQVAYNPNGNDVKQSFQRLHELLINPIADLLPKNPDERVTFIPQSSLFLVPFAALQDKEGKYLVEKHTILTAPAIQVLDLTRQQRQRVSGNQALVLGNPVMPKVAPSIGEVAQQLSTLPGAESEAKEIAQLLNTKAITGKEATKANFMQRLPQARFIHLATHGLLDDFKGLGVPGAVALAPDGKDNGLLTANEILDLKINAELVVLSACDTAQGKVTGDGVVGLSRALISAGAPSVVVTLWSIPDNPSALLMGEFYRQLQQNPDKAKALRQAMLTTMKQHPNPSAWAAFTLIGEAK